jgi:hydrogenase expression/formation protein HypC
MCLATPGVILAIDEGGPQRASATEASLWRTAEVDFGGVRQQVSLACLPEARLGDRVLVHVGVALSLVDDEVDDLLRVLSPGPAVSDAVGPDPAEGS